MKVTGTSFNVNAYSESDVIQEVFEEGRTSFNVKDHCYTMAPGQQLEYNKITGNILLFNLSKPSNVSLWKKNILYFNDTSRAEVLKRVGKKI